MTSSQHQVEICMITTPDGTVDVNGRSGPLGGPADQQRLRSLRETASVVLVGAGTVRAESYRAPSRSDLRSAVVTQSCNLDFSSGLFTSGAGLIVTTTTAPAVPVDSIRAGSTVVDLPAIISQLPAGIVHVEGGPQLNAALLEADVVDAINLTVSPHLSGYRATSLSAPPHALRQFSLVDFRREDDFVFVRYERNRNEQ